MLGRIRVEFIEEGVVPDLLHILLVGDDTVFDRPSERKGLLSRDGVIANMDVHGAVMFPRTNNGREDGARSCLASKASPGGT
jgi:hypothetical protein